MTTLLPQFCRQGPVFNFPSLEACDSHFCCGFDLFLDSIVLKDLAPGCQILLQLFASAVSARQVGFDSEHHASQLEHHSWIPFLNFF